MNKILLKLLVAGGLSILLVSSVWGQNFQWVDFYGSVMVRYQGDTTSVPASVGTIIDAYTQTGIHCGSFTVKNAGQYGFMPVYGDDPYTKDLIEGGSIGSVIYFKINGVKLSPDGPDPIIWAWGVQRHVDLSMSSKVSMQGSTVKGQQIKPGDIVHFDIPIKNTGDGTDFYTLICADTSARGWQIDSDTGSYCDAGKTDTFKIDLHVPINADLKISDTIHYTIQSGTDPSVHVDGILRAFFATTDTPEDRSVLPGGFMLHQNYPNPYNPTTMISYDLSAASDVTLEIFNLLGRKLDHFDLGRQTAGNHSFEYSAGQLPSGIYFYRIQAGDFSDMKKMVLMK